MMKRFCISFRHAFRGFVHAVRTERNMQFHIIATVIVVVAMFLLPTTTVQKMFLAFLVVFVITLELVNTAMERVLNIIEPEYHKQVRIAKDVTAAAVLVGALGSLIIGLAIFWSAV